MKNGIVHKRERKKEEKTRKGGVSFGGRARIGSFYQFELESSTGHPKISKGEISKAFSPPPLPGENTRGIIVPSDPISSRDNSFPEDVELSRYESHWTLQLPPPLFFYPHKSDPLLPPLLAQFFPPRVFERERRSCEKFHSRNASGKRKIRRSGSDTVEERAESGRKEGYKNCRSMDRLINLERITWIE